MVDREVSEERAKLIERGKELSCLYEIAKIVAPSTRSFSEVLHAIVNILPSAFHYPERVGCAIRVDDQVFMTEGFSPSTSRISATLTIEGHPKGVVEVFYKQSGEGSDDDREDRFLPEESNLLQTIARQISLMIEIKLANEKQRDLENQLRHADRLAKMGQLTAGVAHELNEPLSGILGFAQLALKKIESPEQAARFLDRIVQSCLHAREIIKKMMLFSSPMPQHTACVDLNRLLADGISFIVPRFEKSGIRFETDFDPALPSIVADTAQITQVLVNLVINAIQAMPDGGVLTVKTVAVENAARMMVQDTGVGMDARTMEQIFLPFFSTKDVDHGTGLGLSVVHGIINAHHAAIEVQSQVGGGTVFTITFPPAETASAQCGGEQPA
ncbi:sensor histidine kinase [Desulfatitalea alkaliphila]|uniref:histidine kinase n=1 Tax=Desulfatitalea alkaliphila TaxID=2929485 RepID=A0AA41R320_9BACT|nr:ATP-binding protein [Desulfatitalea alkaliphila]MCJ8501127.1 ATP-binding protein [Desulfatitalea alkaliphila]